MARKSISMQTKAFHNSSLVIVNQRQRKWEIAATFVFVSLSSPQGLGRIW